MSILLAVRRYTSEHGAPPAELPEGTAYEALEICRFDVADCTGLVDLSALKPYLTIMPVDPLMQPTSRGTGFTIYTVDGVANVAAPLGEGAFINAQ